MKNNRTVLHISTYYIGNKLYSKLFEKFSYKYHQIIYIPIRNKAHLYKNIENINYTTYYYHKILGIHTKMSFLLKTSLQYAYISKRLDKSISIVHAHSLFSDGGTAYRLYTKNSIKYIVAVRNTDINIFLRKVPHLRGVGFKILLAAEKIILLNEDMLKELEEIYGVKKIKLIMKKIVIIPNGIDFEFINNKINTKILTQTNSQTIFTFIGRLDANKNGKKLIDFISFSRLNKKYYYLNIVGSGKLHYNLIKYAKKRGVSKYINFMGEISGREELIQILDDTNIFIMTSKKETFGIVYLEAMARGVPIIYTKNTGISSYVKNDAVGVAVDHKNIKEYLDASCEILSKYEFYSTNGLIRAKEFTWDIISDKYMELYREVGD